MIDLVLPCLDEVAALSWVMERIPDGVRAIVVDNGSTDGSDRLAAELGALVLRCEQRGYGAACHTGLLAASAELVAFCDCDGSIDPAAVLDLAAVIVAGEADLVVGRRRPRTVRSWPVHARLANMALSWWLRRRTSAAVHDIGPLRVGRRDTLIALGQTDRRSGYPLETIVLAARAGCRIAERDIDYRPRAGRSKVTGTIRGTAQAVRDMSAVLTR